MTELAVLLKNHWTGTSITFQELKTLLDQQYNWKYDPDGLSFYVITNGQKTYINSNKIQVIAAYHGYYGPV